MRTPEAPPLPEDPEGLLRRLRLSGPPVDGQEGWLIEDDAVVV